MKATKRGVKRILAIMLSILLMTGSLGYTAFAEELSTSAEDGMVITEDETLAEGENPEEKETPEENEPGADAAEKVGGAPSSETKYRVAYDPAGTNSMYSFVVSSEESYPDSVDLIVDQPNYIEVKAGEQVCLVSADWGISAYALDGIECVDSDDKIIYYAKYDERWLDFTNADDPNDPAIYDMPARDLTLRPVVASAH